MVSTIGPVMPRTSIFHRHLFQAGVAWVTERTGATSFQETARTFTSDI